MSGDFYGRVMAELITMADAGLMEYIKVSYASPENYLRHKSLPWFYL